MTICEAIDSIIEQKKISRRKLAIMAGISPSSLQSAFQRNTKLSIDMLLKIFSALEINCYWSLQEFGYTAEEESLFVHSLFNAKVNKFVDDSFSEHLMNVYGKLNDYGKSEAIKRMEEMTEVHIFQLGTDYELELALRDGEITQEEYESELKKSRGSESETTGEQ